MLLKTILEAQETVMIGDEQFKVTPEMQLDRYLNKVLTLKDSELAKLYEKFSDEHPLTFFALEFMYNDAASMSKIYKKYFSGITTKVNKPLTRGLTIGKQSKLARQLKELKTKDMIDIDKKNYSSWSLHGGIGGELYAERDETESNYVSIVMEAASNKVHVLFDISDIGDGLQEVIVKPGKFKCRIHKGQLETKYEEMITQYTLTVTTHTL